MCLPEGGGARLKVFTMALEYRTRRTFLLDCTCLKRGPEEEKGEKKLCRRRRVLIKQTREQGIAIFLGVLRPSNHAPWLTSRTWPQGSLCWHWWCDVLSVVLHNSGATFWYTADHLVCWHGKKSRMAANFSFNALGGVDKSHEPVMTGYRSLWRSMLIGGPALT